MRLSPSSAFLLVIATSIACGGSVDETNQAAAAGTGGASGSGGTGGTTAGAAGAGAAGAAAKAGSAGSGAAGTAGAGGACDGLYCVSGKVQLGPCGGPAIVMCNAATAGVDCVPGGQLCPTKPSGTVVGSYDLVFTSVVQTKVPLGASPPSKNRNVRVDIRATSTGFEALFTPKLGTPAVLSVTATATAVTLQGQATITGTSGGGNTTDRWSTITLGVGPTGSLDGTVKGAGTEDAYGGDVIDSTTITGAGSIGTDATKPELQTTLVSPHGPKDAVFPWDALVVRASEGLPPAALEAALSVELAPLGGPGAPLALAASHSFQPTATDANGWGGAVTTALRLTSWDAPSGTLKLSAAQGIPDPTGNGSLPHTAQVPLLAVPAASDQGLDSDVQSVATWGPVLLLGGKTGSDPACEQGGCAKLGPAKIGYFSKDRAGLAGRLKLGAGKVSVRYRVWAKSAAASMPALAVDVFGHDGTVKTVQSPSALALVAESAPFDGFGFASAWSTLELPVPTGDELAFVAYANAQSECGFVPPGYEAIVLIDRVSVE